MPVAVSWRVVHDAWWRRVALVECCGASMWRFYGLRRGADGMGSGEVSADGPGMGHQLWL